MLEHARNELLPKFIWKKLFEILIISRLSMQLISLKYFHSIPIFLELTEIW